MYDSGMRVFQEESDILWQVNNVCAVARKIFVSLPQAFSKPIKRWKRQKDERRALCFLCVEPRGGDRDKIARCLLLLRRRLVSFLPPAVLRYLRANPRQMLEKTRRINLLGESHLSFLLSLSHSLAFFLSV
jgi:hypothetical protein